MTSFDRHCLRVVPLLLGSLLFVACATQPSAARPAPMPLTAPVALPAPVSLAAYERHLAILSADRMEGRKPGTDGELKTLAYLTAQFKALGLMPGNGDSWLQRVPMMEITTSPAAARMRFDAANGWARDLKYATDVVMFTKRVVSQVHIDKASLVFVGHGIVAPEYHWNDYAGVDMHGKVAVILINDPGFDNPDPEFFRGRAMTYYGRWTYKFEEAARQGAQGAIIVHEAKPAAYPWGTVVNSWSGALIDKATPDGNMGRVKVESWITHEQAQVLFAAVGSDFAAAKVRAQLPGFKPEILPATVSVSLSNAIRNAESANVIATIPGSKRPHECVIYTAHWDAFGRNDAPGDPIFNGAIDNATGVAGLLSLAAAFKRAEKPPERTVVFLSVTAEEQGLLGSAYYVANTVFPLAQTVAVMNMDAIPYGGPTRDVSLVGAGASELEPYLVAAAARQQRVVNPEPTPEKGSFFRSDHFNFAKAGVPALYFNLGIDDREQGAIWGQQQRDNYEANDYHKPSDEYHKGVDLRGGLQNLQLLYAIGARLAGETSFPNWYQNSEFRAARDHSRAIMRQ